MAGIPGRRAPYKDTLQPALHRRFSSTATLLLGVSYLEALLLTTWSSYLWSWFPLGPAGIRTVLIFGCGLAILVLRIAHYHVGLRTTESGLQILDTSLLRLEAYETGFWYGVSSFLFCPVYLSAMSDTSNLRWITFFSGDRARLNERPLFLACYLGTCGLLQTIAHYRVDIDRLDLGLSRRRARDEEKTLRGLPGSFQTVVAQLPAVLAGCVKQAISALFLALVLYYFFLRSFAWGWALTFLRPFYNLPKTSLLPPSWPSDIFLLARCVYAGTLLNFVWSAGNTAFSIFMAKEPLKNGKPLTSESKDPNGSLLNGLKSQKLSIKSFAMWELALIAQDFETRRQAIYCDIDRKDGPMWAQIYAICMDILKSVESRADDFGKPVASAAAAETTCKPSKQRVFAPLRADPILNTRAHAPGLAGGVEKAWDQIARAPGASPASELSPLAKKAWRSARDQMLSKEQQEALSPDKLKGKLEQRAVSLMKVAWIGALFRHDFRLRFAAAVLGTPYAEPTLYVNAAQALCQLAVHSLAEDAFGNVHRDVASIVRTLTAVIRKVEQLKARFPPHWTDPSGVKETPEVDEVMDALRTGLDQVVTKFERYSNDLRLSPGDVRLAKEAAVKPKEATSKSRSVEKVVVEEDGHPTTTTMKNRKNKKNSEPRRGQGAERQRIEMEQV